MHLEGDVFRGLQHAGVNPDAAGYVGERFVLCRIGAYKAGRVKVDQAISRPSRIARARFRWQGDARPPGSALLRISRIGLGS